MKGIRLTRESPGTFRVGDGARYNQFADWLWSVAETFDEARAGRRVVIVGFRGCSYVFRTPQEVAQFVCGMQAGLDFVTDVWPGKKWRRTTRK